MSISDACIFVKAVISAVEEDVEIHGVMHHH